MLKAKEAKKNAAAPASKKEKFAGNAATATVRLGGLFNVRTCVRAVCLLFKLVAAFT